MRPAAEVEVHHPDVSVGCLIRMNPRDRQNVIKDAYTEAADKTTISGRAPNASREKYALRASTVCVLISVLAGEGGGKIDS